MLIDQGSELAYLVDEQAAHHLPSANDREQFLHARDDAITEQKRAIKTANDNHKKAMESKFADQIAKKRAERAAKRAEAAAKAPPSDETTSQDASFVMLSAPETEERIDEEPSAGASKRATNEEDLSDIVYPVKIRGASAGLPWYETGPHSYHSLEDARAAGIWNYPTTPDEVARCKVFQDLWENGHFMGNGLRFGGSFLVYPGKFYPAIAVSHSAKASPSTGDPMRYHSHFSTSVYQDSSVPVSPVDIVSSGRLATAVKKAHLLCAPSKNPSAEQQVQYFSLEWAGMG